MVRRFRRDEEIFMHSQTNGARRRDVYQDITDKIAAAIERGAPEFRLPWHQGIAALGRPVNAYTDFAYRGVNVVALWAASEFGHFGSRYWATYKQWRLLGAQVREGERGTTIVFFKETTREAYDEERGEVVGETRLIARSSFVFNSDQVDGWALPELPARDPVETMKEAELFVAGTEAEIRYGGSRAYFQPFGDFIQMPERELFTGTDTCTATEGFYATLFHELIHWSGHTRRLNRDLLSRFGDDIHAMEELVAELGAAFLCADLRITNTPRLDHAAYISHWLDVLRKDKKALLTAASKAAAAADYLAWLQPREEVSTTEREENPVRAGAMLPGMAAGGEEGGHGR